MKRSLELIPAMRPGEDLASGTKIERRFFDFVIDGDSLNALIIADGLDEVGCLGWGTVDSHSEAQSRLIGESAGDFADGRVSLFICPECGDLGCGAVSAKITRDGSSLTWSEIGWQNNYEEGYRPMDGLGPFSFEFKQYRELILQAVLLEHA